MGDNTAPQRPQVPVGATRNHKVSFVGQLDSGELLTGTPLAVEVTTSDLTITNKAVNSAALTINNKTVAIGQAVTFTASGQLVASSPYTVKITATTDATAAQTLVAYAVFDAVTD